MRIVVALGGNAIAIRGEPLDTRRQVERIAIAAEALAGLVEDGHDLVITHGNGPQVGLLASLHPELPLDVVGAETEGMLGYWIERELLNRLPDREIATLLTQVEVDPSDPAFRQPTKPIGPVLPLDEKERVPESSGEIQYAKDGDGYRRVVASPDPVSILERRTISRLSSQGVLVICSGGGGIPVTRDAMGRFHGCEAVVDKDRSAALLADQLDSDVLLLLTDVAGVYDDWPDPAKRMITHTRVAEIRDRVFDPGSIGPKVAAACAFANRTGRVASIGALESAVEIVRGEVGTHIHL